MNSSNNLITANKPKFIGQSSINYSHLFIFSFTEVYIIKLNNRG